MAVRFRICADGYTELTFELDEAWPGGPVILPLPRNDEMALWFYPDGRQKVTYNDLSGNRITSYVGAH